MAGAATLRQFGVIPYRFEAGGALRILLITSRDTGRWVVPRGNPIAGLPPHRSAAQEAWEEAGILGSAGAEAIGIYPYSKRRKDGSSDPALVQLFPFEVREQKADWPERGERETRWFDRQAAAAAVDEAELKALILAFDPSRVGA